MNKFKDWLRHRENNAIGQFTPLWTVPESLENPEEGEVYIRVVRNIDKEEFQRFEWVQHNGRIRLILSFSHDKTNLNFIDGTAEINNVTKTKPQAIQIL